MVKVLSQECKAPTSAKNALVQITNIIADIIKTKDINVKEFSWLWRNHAIRKPYEGD